ncbi:MAG: alpha/beta hydrolase-fold protein, partial [Calditrichia bacterium]
LSMGGHGSLYLAIRHPQTYAVVSAMSGVLDLRHTTQPAALAEKLGALEEFPGRWINNSVINMADSLQADSLSILIDCGVDDIFIESNRLFHRRLLSRNIPHSYIERPGGHTADYWKNAIDYHLLYFQKFFRENL